MERIYFRDYMKRELEHRYAMFSRPRNGDINPVCDSYMPNVISSDFDYVDIPKTGQFISRWFASMCNVRPIPINDLTSMLGYKPKDIKQLLMNVKKNQHYIVMLGMGGTGSNFLYWLQEMCYEHNVKSIFSKIIAYDDDSYDFSNMFRLPFNSEAIFENYNTKASLVYNFQYLSSKGNVSIPFNFIINSEYERYHKVSNGFVYFGAPNIRTREMLYNAKNDKDFLFISATHGDDDCSVSIFPNNNSYLQVESYGMIRLSTFFMNQIYMTIKTLEILAEPVDEIDKTPRKVAEYNFAKEYLNGNIGKASKTYNFYVEHSGIVGDVV